MPETVSVDEAIKKGIYTVNLPALLIFIIGLTGSFALAFVFVRPYEMILGIIITCILAATYRAFMAAKWRIWAFDNVRNVHNLHERALTEKLLYLTNWPGYGIINYNSTSQKEKWEQLQAKFNRPDIFIDDNSVAAETVIRHSLLRKLVWTSVFILMATLGIYFCTLGRAIGYIFGGVLIILGGVLSYKNIKDLFDRKAQIIINNDGMSTANTPFYKWEEISNEKAIVQGSGKYATYYLCYDHPNGSSKFHLDDHDIRFRQLQRLLCLYRGRSEHGRQKG